MPPLILSLHFSLLQVLDLALIYAHHDIEAVYLKSYIRSKQGRSLFEAQRHINPEVEHERGPQLPVHKGRVEYFEASF